MHKMDTAIKLVLCPVCMHATSGTCNVKTVSEYQEKCNLFVYKGAAEWIFYSECPKCEGGGMLFQDKFGAVCAISGCEFTQDYDV